MANYKLFDKNAHWRPEEDEFIQENFQNLSDEEIGIKLQRTTNAVKVRRTKKLSLHRTKKTPLWSKEELLFLEENAGLYSIKTLSKKLNRTENAIKHKLFRIFKTTDPLLLNGTYSTDTLAKLIGNTRGKILYWINHHNLPAQKLRVNVTSKKTRQRFYYAINLEEFYKWFKKVYKKIEVDFSNSDPTVVPYCPDWFLQEIRNKTFHGKCKFWSKEEEATLIYYLHKTDLNNKDIAKKMNRSYRSICGKVSSLQKKLKNNKGYLEELKKCKVVA